MKERLPKTLIKLIISEKKYKQSSPKRKKLNSFINKLSLLSIRKKQIKLWKQKLQ